MFNLNNEISPNITKKAENNLRNQQILVFYRDGITYLLDMDTISEIQTELSHFKAHPLVGQEQKLKVNNPKHMDKQNVFNRTCNR